MNERKFLLKNLFIELFLTVIGQKKRFLEGMVGKFINSEKLIVILPICQKQNLYLNKKKKFITFVGKLNKSKGYDVFGKAVLKNFKKV